MGRRSIKERNIRTLMRVGAGSLAMTIPIEIVHTMGLRKGQKVVVQKKGKSIVIKDWNPKRK